MFSPRRIPWLIALALCVVGVATASARGDHPRRFDHQRQYEFIGDVTSVDVAGSHLGVNVLGGNRWALRAMIGQPAGETFTVDAHTRYVSWDAGVPGVTGLGAIQVGQRVRIHIVAPQGASLSDLLAKPARRVAVRLSGVPHVGRVWTFVGNCTATTASNISLNVTGGNWIALYKMLGQPVAQTFALDPAKTILVAWQRGIPSLITPDKLPAYCAKQDGNVTVRLFARRDATLQQVEAAPAFRVAFHTPPAWPHQ